MTRRLAPYPVPVSRPGGVLDLTIKIETPTGWLDLNDGVGYTAEASTLGERSVTWRKQEAESPWVEGSYAVNAVRDDVVETISIWVRGDNRHEAALRRKRLTDALGQLGYRMLVRVEEVSEYWDCEPADYQLTSSREMQHANLCMVKASVPRKPEVEILLATGDEL